MKMALNKVILFGRLTRDPEFRQTTAGTPVCKFTVACDRPFANKQTGEREADFIDVQAWRNTAEFVSRWFTKGSSITVEGSLRNNNYTDKDGVKHYGYVVMADNVGFGGSKNENGGQQQQQGYNPSMSPYQNQVVNQYAQQQNYAPRAAAPAQDAVNIGNIGEFEEILSDGEIPF
jgi:single-strand DNA-binding protein